jgi:hypothetical protein
VTVGFFSHEQTLTFRMMALCLTSTNHPCVGSSHHRSTAES